MSVCRFGISVAAASLLASPAIGQTTAPAEPPTSPASEEVPAAMGDIIVTAQRRSEKLRDVPLSIVAQTREDLERAGVSGTKDLSQVVAGLTFGSQGAQAQPGIRGVQSLGGSAGTDTPIAIYVDGFYQSNQVANFMDLPDVAQVEVLKGPQGTLFGRNATGGAISIRTMDPLLDKATGSLKLSNGLFFGDGVKTSNDFVASGFISVPLVSDVLAISASGYYDHNDGYMTNIVTGGRYGRIENYLGRLKLLFKPSELLRFTLSGIISRRVDETTTMVPLNGVTVASQYPDAIIPTQPWQAAGENGGGSFVLAKYRGISLISEWRLPSAGTFTSHTGYTYSYAPAAVDVDASYAPSCRAAVACVNYLFAVGPSKTFQQEVSFASDKFGMFSFVAGGFYYRERMNQTQSVNPTTLPGQPINTDPSIYYFNIKKATTEAYAGFGEVYFDPSASLRLIAGIRYSNETKKGALLAGIGPATIPGGSWSAWTPRFSVLYRISKDVNFYATYSKGFKSGTPNLDTGTAPANPENLTAFEAGFKIGTPWLSLNASAFHYDYSNLQVQAFNGISVTNVNAAKAEIYGVDIDGSIKLSPSFEVRAAASWVPRAKYLSYPGAIDYDFPEGPFGLQMVTVDASGTRLLKAPKLTGSVSVNYNHDVGIGELDASATLYHASSMRWDVLGRIKTGSYVTLSGQVGITLKSVPVRIALFGKNLTNKAYVTGTILGAIADGVIYSQPRQVGLSAEYKF